VLRRVVLVLLLGEHVPDAGWQGQLWRRGNLLFLFVAARVVVLQQLHRRNSRLILQKKPIFSKRRARNAKRTNLIIAEKRPRDGRSRKRPKSLADRANLLLLLLLLDAVFGSVVTIQPGLVWKIQFRILGKFPCEYERNRFANYFKPSRFKFNYADLSLVLKSNQD